MKAVIIKLFMFANGVAFQVERPMKSTKKATETELGRAVEYKINTHNQLYSVYSHEETEIVTKSK